MVEIIFLKNWKKAVKKTTKLLHNDCVVAYPTETSYGLAALATSKKAIQKLTKAKKQPKNKPISVLFSSITQAKKHLKIPKNTEKAMKTLKKKPITWICTKKNKHTILPHLYGNTLAFRISTHPLAHALTKQTKQPITATSANIHKEPELYDPLKILQKIGNHIDAIIWTKKLPKRKTTTIYDCTTNKTIREGTIKEKKIKQTINKK
jgi:L-threonylcarbamoyladenylate synthase